MRRPCRRPRPAGCVAVAAGVIILLGLLLPAGFWWVALGLGLIMFGLWLLRL